MTASPLRVRRCLLGAPVLLFVTAIAAACGGTTADETVHRVPGFEISLALPASWDAVDYQSSADELDRFEREHPKFFGIADALRSRSKFAAALKPGDVRLLLSIDDAGSGYTLRRHIERNLPQLEGDSPGLGIRIHGPHDEIVELGGGEAWRIRWSYRGDLGRIQLVQYTMIRDGLLYLLTYSTLKPWGQSADMFAASADSIRIGDARDVAHTTVEGQIVFHRELDGDRSDIYVMSASADDERPLTRTGTDSLPAWSPDGKLIAFTRTRNGNSEIYVMEADGSGQRRLTTRPGLDADPSWSPDGRRIMFSRGRKGDDDSYDLYELSVEGGELTRLTRDGESSDGSWSPDGGRIVFWSGRDFGSGVYVMSADGSAVRHLTADFETAWHPSWSPDGETILFVGSTEDPTTGDEETAIYRMNADGGDVTKIATPTGYWIDEPVWSPDGASIAFFSDGEGPGAIWVMNADGTQQRALTTAGDDHSPSWQLSAG